MSEQYVSYEKAIARHDDDEWLSKRIDTSRMYVLMQNGRYGVIVWQKKGRFEFRGLRSRAEAEREMDRFPFDEQQPGCYEVTRMTSAHYSFRLVGQWIGLHRVNGASRTSEA